MNNYCQVIRLQNRTELPVSLQITPLVPEISDFLASTWPDTMRARMQIGELAAAPDSAPVTEPKSCEEEAMAEHLPMVRYIARRIHERLPQHIEIEDLVSAGVVGLMDAFQKFDAAKQVQFRSYAQFRVRGAILDSLRTLDWGPRELRRKGRAIEAASRMLTGQLGRGASEAEIAEAMDMDLCKYQQVAAKIRGLEVGTLHMEHDDSSEDELAQVPARTQENPLFLCLKAESQARLAAAIETLSERERLVITLYYYEELTMREIGLALSLGESRVSQIHTAAILHLRAVLEGTREEKQKMAPKKRRA